MLLDCSRAQDSLLGDKRKDEYERRERFHGPGASYFKQGLKAVTSPYFYLDKSLTVVANFLIHPGYDIKLHLAALSLLSSSGRSLRRSLAPLRYW